MKIFVTSCASTLFVFLALLQTTQSARAASGAQAANGAPGVTPAVVPAVVPSVVPAIGPAIENWKGKTEVSPIELGLMTGTSIYGSSANWGVLASGAYLLSKDGFLSDIDDRLWAEVQLGPTFFNVAASSHTGMQYSAHVRWDFTYNEYWTFYALGGLGGFVLPDVLGSSFTLHPRLGLGVEYQTKTALLFRGEVSAEFVGLGVAFNF